MLQHSLNIGAEGVLSDSKGFCKNRLNGMR